MAEKQGSRLYNRQVCFFTGETQEQRLDSRQTLEKTLKISPVSPQGWEQFPLGLKTGRS